MTATDESTPRPLDESQCDEASSGLSDDTVPSKREALTFPVIGVGASAGGLEAFEAFFSGLSAHSQPDMAFVLVQHLAPDHKSFLSDLIQRHTAMRVREVEDGMVLEPGCAYIIPPNCDMALLGGALHLLEPSAPRGQRMPIDFFFRSLAQDQHERAIGIVLSGTGSDGAIGVRAIKGEGGMVMAQDPVDLKYDGMPRQAINTGLVDFVLPPQEMASQLFAYVARAFRPSLRPERPLVPKSEHALGRIFVILRNRTNHDFSQYKPSTVNRRIARRMAVHQIGTLEEYAEYLQHNPGEADALFRDMLIGVTSFFRDPSAFATLETQIIPKLLANRPGDGMVRIWSAGCSTGEEAVSLAILLAERQEAMRINVKVQIFATDIDAEAIATARSGIYPASIVADLSAERLSRYFTATPDGSTYRVHKAIRDMLVFSEQDVIRDPPFSRLDLICCRNLLIYMGSELQRKLIPLFHYALGPNGYLFLGASETVGEFDDYFVTVDRKAKLYQRKGGILMTQRGSPGRLLSPTTRATPATAPLTEPKTATAKTSLGELTEQAILRQFNGVGVLVNGHGDIFYLHGRTGQYLEPTPGEVGVNNILKMAREGLCHPLTSALCQAVATNETTTCEDLSVKTNGHFTRTKLTVRPINMSLVSAFPAPLYVVILEPLESRGPEQDPTVPSQSVGGEVADADASTEAETRIADLRRELRAKEEYLRSATEELETSNEELRSANEEMQSVNEELQSTNEELETSKEELQSLNEELATVNSELQAKVTDLSQANNDMNNLLAGTGIGTVFVDHQLRILRFTPSVTQIINLIGSDAGRPVGHIVSNIVGYNGLVEDTQSVLSTLVPKEVEVQTTAGTWYSMRILPYRTLNNVIEGAVITFIDISAAKFAAEALRQAGIDFKAK